MKLPHSPTPSSPTVAGKRAVRKYTHATTAPPALGRMLRSARLDPDRDEGFDRKGLVGEDLNIGSKAGMQTHSLLLISSNGTHLREEVKLTQLRSITVASFVPQIEPAPAIPQPRFLPSTIVKFYFTSALLPDHAKPNPHPSLGVKPDCKFVYLHTTELASNSKGTVYDLRRAERRVHRVDETLKLEEVYAGKVFVVGERGRDGAGVEWVEVFVVETGDVDLVLKAQFVQVSTGFGHYR